MKKIFILLAFNFHCLSMEKYGNLDDYNRFINFFNKTSEKINDMKNIISRYTFFKNCIREQSKDFSNIPPSTYHVYDEDLEQSIIQYIDEDESYTVTLQKLEISLKKEKEFLKDVYKILTNKIDRIENTNENFKDIACFAEELITLEKQLISIKDKKSNFPSHRSGYSSGLLEEEFTIINDYRKYLISQDNNSYDIELLKKINQMENHIDELKNAFKEHFMDILDSEYNPENKNNKKISDEILKLLKIKNEVRKSSVRIEDINRTFGKREISLKDLRSYIIALNNDASVAQKEIDNIKLDLYSKHYNLNDEDHFRIVQAVLEEKVKNPKIETAEILENIILYYYRKEFNKLNDIYNPIVGTEDIERAFVRSIYGSSHLLLRDVQNSRKETNEKYQDQLSNFFNNLERLHLNLNEKMTASLKLLNKDRDAGLRGFYCNIFESNPTDDEISFVFEALNSAEGCPDIARLKYQEFRALDKKNNNDIQPGSLQELKQKIYKHLQEKRYNFFDDLIKYTHLYDLKNSENFSEHEKGEYGIAYVLEKLSKSLGLKNIEIDTMYDYTGEGEKFINEYKKFFLDMFKEAYNAKFILDESFKVAKDYEKSILRYLQMKYYLSNEKQKVVPRFHEEDGTAEETEYMDENYEMKPKALQEVMEDLFGFHNLIEE